MTVPKRIKGKPFRKKVKKSTAAKSLLKKTAMAKINPDVPKKWQKDINIEFEDEFLNNSLSINNILE